jgi:kynureninase
MIPPTPSADPRDELLGYRDEFPILDRKIYLNSCSLGALSHRAEVYLADFLDHWHEMGASAWYEHWMGRLAQLRSGVGTFLGTDQKHIALLPSTSAALAVVAETTTYAARNRVICADLDFPTLAYQWAVKPEVELVILRSPDGVGIDPQQFQDAVDERTAFIATSHVFFATGFRQDVEVLAEIAHSVGARCLIDGYHGAGQIPVDLGSSAVDFYTTGPLKWMLGGPGLSYLWANDRQLLEARPRITSWFAHKNQFAFDLERFEYHDDARRFELGTPALPTVHTALGGQEILNEIGPWAIAERNAFLTDHLVNSLEDAGFGLTLARDPAHRTAIVMVQHSDAPGAVRHLASQGIIVDHRPGHVRVSPHFYNTVGELDRFVAVLGETRGA